MKADNEKHNNKELDATEIDSSSAETDKTALMRALENYNISSSDSFNIFGVLKKSNSQTEEESIPLISKDRNNTVDQIEIIQKGMLKNGLMCNPHYYTPFGEQYIAVANTQ